MSTQTRVRAGTPTGGQFAAVLHAESDISLEAAALDGTALDPIAGAWHDAGLTDTDAQEWIDAGFTPPTNVPSRFADWEGTQDIESWIALDMSASYARLLESRGVTAEMAGEHIEAGLTPEGDEVCRECGTIYSTDADGYDGLCPTCADVEYGEPDDSDTEDDTDD